LLEDRENIFAIVIDGEALEVGIGVAFVIAVKHGCGIGGANAGAIDAESEFRRMEKLVQELVTGWLCS